MTVRRALFACLLASAVPASATVIVDQPGSNNAPSVLSSPWITGSIRSFDDFILSGNYTITAVAWHGWAASQGTSFEIGFATTSAPFYPDVGSLVTQTVVPTVTAVPGIPWEDEFFVTLPTPVALTAGTGYWLSIYNPNSFWGWSDGDGSATHGVVPPDIAASYIATGGTPYVVFQQGDLAFRLEGDLTPPPAPVPEPASLFLLGAGLLGLRRKRSTH